LRDCPAAELSRGVGPAAQARGWCGTLRKISKNKKEQT
jgi:hypothetical protein